MRRDPMMIGVRARLNAAMVMLGNSYAKPILCYIHYAYDADNMRPMLITKSHAIQEDQMTRAICNHCVDDAINKKLRKKEKPNNIQEGDG